MIVKLADYIVSPLAMGTHANYEQVKAGRTMLRRYTGKWGLPEPFVASLIDDAQLAEACRESGVSMEDYTRFEQLAILSAARALQEVDIQPADDDVWFFLSTTKGNIALLGDESDSSLLLTEAAKRVAAWFRNANTPLVVCNACISGMDAQLEALRALETGQCRYAVVVGADVVSPFIVSGFQSLKALSADLCRPFDEERIGLNLGEAAACVVYARAEDARSKDVWSMVGGAVRNDAYHISTPSKTAEGASRALRVVLSARDLSTLAFINVHGTATLFNDEMEAVAIDRMKLNACPVNGLKGYFGHTLGAAGVLETLISMEALEDGLVLATKGFERIGVSRQVNISPFHRKAEGRSFLKLMAGFGGCNAVLLFSKGENLAASECQPLLQRGRISHTVHLRENKVVVDGQTLYTEGHGMMLLKYVYHTYVGDYPKFHKMDPLCKLGFLASELLLEAEAKAENRARFVACEDRAVVMVGRSASLCADKAYQETICSTENYYPSPSAFIYTLPNIVTGEIAIRNHYHGETTYLLQETPANVLQLLAQVLRAPGTRSVLGGWIDVPDADTFEAILYLIN